MTEKTINEVDRPFSTMASSGIQEKCEDPSPQSFNDINHPNLVPTPMTPLDQVLKRMKKDTPPFADFLGNPNHFPLTPTPTMLEQSAASSLFDRGPVQSELQAETQRVDDNEFHRLIQSLLETISAYEREHPLNQEVKNLIEQLRTQMVNAEDSLVLSQVNSPCDLDIEKEEPRNSSGLVCEPDRTDTLDELRREQMLLEIKVKDMLDRHRTGDSQNEEGENKYIQSTNDLNPPQDSTHVPKGNRISLMIEQQPEQKLKDSVFYKESVREMLPQVMSSLDRDSLEKDFPIQHKTIRQEEQRRMSLDLTLSGYDKSGVDVSTIQLLQDRERCKYINTILNDHFPFHSLYELKKMILNCDIELRRYLSVLKDILPTEQEVDYAVCAVCHLNQISEHSMGLFLEKAETKADQWMLILLMEDEATPHKGAPQDAIPITQQAIHQTKQLRHFVRAWIGYHRFQCLYPLIKEHITCLEEACMEMKNSKSFFKFLGVVLALINCLYSTGDRELIWGFQISSLGKLLAVKNGDESTCLLNYIDQLCCEKYPDLKVDSLLSELSHVPNAANISLDLLSLQIDEVQHDLHQLIQFRNEQVLECNFQLYKSLCADDNLNEMQDQLAKVEERWTNLLQNIRSVRELYCERESDQMKAFQSVSQFLASLQAAHNENASYPSTNGE